MTIYSEYLLPYSNTQVSRIYVTIVKLFSWIRNVYLKLATGLTGALCRLSPYESLSL